MNPVKIPDEMCEGVVRFMSSIIKDCAIHDKISPTLKFPSQKHEKLFQTLCKFS